uniref:Putative steroid receptor rna activator sra1 n=1 Tax=Nyssomyia neivai TaxID=330878 RepID=A0A1L8DZP8_9DIPT
MSEKSTENKPTFPPGWNDPPKLGNPSPNRTKLNLNKRIAFPMSSQGSGEGQKVELAPSGLPAPFARVSSATQPAGNVVTPETSACDIAPPPCSPRVKDVKADDILDDTQESVTPEVISEMKMREVLRNLDVFAKKIDDKKVQEEVLRRMDLLRVQTNKNELCEEIKRNLVKICEALNEENFIEANEFHRKLMVDYHTDCSSWGSSLRNIILAAQDPKEPQDDAIKNQIE